VSIAFAEHVGPWTIADVEALPDAGDHSRYELLTPGVLTVSPAPGTVHQRVSRRLANLLDAAATAACADVEILEAVNVEIPGGRLAIPDIAVVNGEYADTDPLRYPPDQVRAVVEVVSPSTHPQDRIIKPQLYADARIPVYWRLELEKTPQLIVSTLRRGQFVHIVTATAGQPSEIPCPFPIKLDPAELVRRAVRAN
jgi:Uma2 family endonuclease